jgi:hypothetical protein
MGRGRGAVLPLGITYISRPPIYIYLLSLCSLKLIADVITITSPELLCPFKKYIFCLSTRVAGTEETCLDGWEHT